MKSRFAVLLAVVSTSLGLVACGGGGDTTATETSTSAETSAKSSTDERIQKIEQETKEVELEAALAKKEAAQQAAKAKKAAAKQAAAANAEAAQSAQPEAESTSEAPDVIGMRLPEAETVLRGAGFGTNAENTDTTLGIVVKSHYTICTESEPHGNVVTVLAQKYGC
jgi:alpha-acetolactate decarboxylase